MNVLIINGHPREKSLSESIAENFEAGAIESGAKVRSLDLHELKFNADVITPSPRMQSLEPDLLRAQEWIFWADHLVFVYPTWWGTMPAKLKGFLDRVLTEGFAFEDIEGGTGYEPLLNGRTAQLITTMDTPGFVYNFFYGAPGHKAMKNATLGFCGIKPVKVLRFGAVKKSTEPQRKKWLEISRKKGRDLRDGFLSTPDKIKIKTSSWLKAIRLQFYPMTWVAYACGGFAAERFGYGYSTLVFWIGYLWLFLVEVSTVLFNDYFDYKSDKHNRYFSPFTGGSRVLVDKSLSFKEIRNGAVATLALSFPVFIFLLNISPGNNISIIASGFILLFFAIGYTVPPVKLSYRTLGEVTVGITHSLAVIIMGYIFQGGKIGDDFPWMVSLPLFLGVLPSIILAGLPDYEADRSAGKRTIAVKFGKKRAVSLAIAFTLCAALTAMLINILQSSIYGYMIYAVIPHAALLTWLLINYLKDPAPPQRIDGLLIASLTYLVWFGVTAL